MKKSLVCVMGVPPPPKGRPCVTVFNHFTDSDGDSAHGSFRGLSPSKWLRLDWPVKRDLILYFAYCIGLTLIGLLMAIGWRDFFAASRASTAVSRICLDCFRK